MECQGAQVGLEPDPTRLSADVGRTERRDWISLAILTLPCVIYSMDLTVLNLAAPSLADDLKPTPAQLLWIMDVYGFVLASLLIPMGVLGDRVGRRRVLLWGAATFSIASILAASSRSVSMLIAMRAVLGVAGATLAPGTLSLIRTIFRNDRDRALAVSIWVASYSLGAAAGPLIGGVLLQYFGWGSVFLIGIPVMLALLVLGPTLLPEYRSESAGRIDFTSTASLLAGVLTMTYGLKRFAEDGFSAQAALIMCVGAGLSTLFVHRQRRLSTPMINLRLFDDPAFATAVATYSMGCFVALGVLFFVAQDLQLVLGLSPLQAGLWSLPFAMAFVVGSILAPHLTKRMAPHYIVVAGLLVSAGGLGALGLLARDASPAVLCVVCCTYSFGLACVFTVTNDLIIGSAPSEHTGAAAAISETGSELGGALGIAVLGSVGTVVYRTVLAHSISGLNPTSLGTLGAAIAAARLTGGTVGEHLIEAARVAFSRGLQMVAVVSSVAMMATSILVARYWGASGESVRNS